MEIEGEKESREREREEELRETGEGKDERGQPGVKRKRKS